MYVMSSEQKSKDEAEQAQTRELSGELEDLQLKGIAGGTTEPPDRTEKQDTFTQMNETDRSTFRR